MKVSQKVNLLVAVLLTCELLFFGSLYALLQEAEADARKIQDSRTILTNINRLTRTIVSLSLRIRSLTLASDKETAGLIRTMYLQMSELEDACRDHPREQQAVRRIRNTLVEGMTEFARAQERIKSGEWIEAKDEIEKIKPLLQEMGDKFDEIKKDQESIEMQFIKLQTKQRTQTRNVLTAGLAINIFMGFLFVSLFNRGVTSRLRHLLRNTHKLSVGDKLEPPMPGGDEIAQLDRAFHDVATALTTAMKKQDAIFQHAVEVICTLNEEDKFSEVSSSSARVFGFEPEELVGMRLFDILIADEVEGAKQFLHNLRTVNPQGEFESKVRKKNGPFITVHFSAEWSRQENTIFLVALDITERKNKQVVLEEAETRLRHIIESLPIGLVMTNLRGVIKLANPVFDKMLSINATDVVDKSEIIDRPIGEFVKVSGEDDVMVFLEKCEGKAIETEVTIANNHEGSSETKKTLTAEISVRQIETTDGKRLVILIVDVSERAEIERMKQQFVAMVSHDLRTPLMAVQVYLELLENGTYGSLTETGTKKLKAVDDNLTRLTKLISDLLDVERLESGTLSSRKRPVNLDEIFDSSHESVQAAANKAEIKVTFRDADIELNADPDRIVQVLVNLITNALKFSPANSTISIDAQDEGESVLVSVTDQGRGIPKEFKEKIFERFQQVSLDDAARKGGAGLGLAICRSIIQQHEGEISVDSEEGKGSRFWFRLPKS